MIQYKHYHDENAGYVDKLSKSGSSQDSDVFSTLASFKRVKDTCFTYSPKNGKAYLMQVSEKTNMFYHGLADTLESFGNTRITEYIDKLETEHKTDVDKDGKLPDGELPKADPKPMTSLARGLKPIFAEAVNTILYTDKPVVLVGENRAELIRYVKVILSLFPVQYANRIGFSVCPTDLPSFFVGASTDIARSIRIVATDSRISESASRVVIDVNAAPKKDGFGPYAEAVARVSNELIKGNDEKLAALTEATDSSFLPDGGVDLEKLEISLTVFEYNADKNAENAQTLIKVWQSDENKIIKLSCVVDAVKLLLGEKELTNEQKELIAKAREDSKINNEVSEICREKAYGKLADGKPLDRAEIKDAKEYFKSLRSNELNPESSKISELFETCKVSTVEILADVYCERSMLGYLKVISRYVSVLNGFDCSYEFNKELLGVATKKFNELKSRQRTQGTRGGGLTPEKAEVDILSAIMLSCYAPEASGKKRASERIDALGEFIKAKGLSVPDTLKYILMIREKMLEASRETEAFNIPDNFAVVKKELIDKSVSTLTFIEKLDIATGDTMDISVYHDMKMSFIAGLTSLATVKEYVTLGRNLSKYLRFMSRFESELRVNTYADIRRYIGGLVELTITGDQITDYRCKFVLGFYSGAEDKVKSGIERQTGSKEEQIKEALSINSDKSTEDLEEKLRVAEIVSCSMRRETEKSRGKKGTENLTALLVAYLFSVIYAVLSAAVILAVPVLTAMLLGVDIQTRVIEFVNLFHVCAVVFVALFNIASHLYHWNATNKDKRRTFRKMNTQTVLFCIVPILLYAISYLITYAIN